MNAPKYTSICDWYLARLRKIVTLRAEARALTPLSLVESDKKLIHELVARESDTLANRSEKLLKEHQSRKHWTEQVEHTSIIIAVAGIVLILFAFLI